MEILGIFSISLDNRALVWIVPRDKQGPDIGAPGGLSHLNTCAPFFAVSLVSCFFGYQVS